MAHSRTFTKLGSAPSNFRWEILGGIISGLLVGLFLFVGQIVVDNNRSDREHDREDRQITAQNKIEADRNEQGILLENLRFVRGLSSSTDATTSRPFRGMDLRGLELATLSLAGADFQNADLRGTSFRYAELTGARFGGANLDGADFTGADLTHASFAYSTDETKSAGKGPTSLALARLDHAFFRDISTWGEVNISGSSLCGAVFEEVDFSEAFMSGSTLDEIPPEGLTLPDLKNAGVELCSQ